MPYAYIEAGRVVEVVRVDPFGIFGADYASKFMEVPDEVESGWLADGVGGFNRPPCPPVTSVLLRQALAIEYDKRMQVIAAGYPPSERESWPVQTEEARALATDPAAATPWIDAAALARGLDRMELAERICAKDDAYRQIHGALTGTRQRIEDQIDAAGDDAAELSLIDVRAGWPASPV